MNHFTVDDYSERYKHNIMLSQIGREGQEILHHSKVLVIGAGALACPLLLYLAAAGIGYISIIDFDRVTLSNLQRQILYDEKSIGQYKVIVARNKIKELNTNCHVEPYIAHIEEKAEIIAQHDIVVDCLDNFTSRFFVNKQCFILKKPLVFGAVNGFIGHVAIFKAYQNYPCYQCYCPSPQNVPLCGTTGVLGTVAGMIGAIQGTYTLKELLQLCDNYHILLRLDMLTNRLCFTKITKEPQCSVCS